MNELNSLYDLIGGETGLRTLVDRFYDLMDTSPEARDIRALHAKSLNQSREKLFMFLSGWSGGPSLYIEKYGHPRLRQRHMPFSIGDVERDQWLWCMNKALDESGFLPPLWNISRRALPRWLILCGIRRKNLNHKGHEGTRRKNQE
ncbi:group II truncated hemoglobin [Candidatus Villigracilis saccharophilus]|uniref:group II truncated hemoglobin n=1 Tax=Candidatus Villigracilis saccharophilus TaxID=3140684 RepID=UPI0031E591F8